MPSLKQLLDDLEIDTSDLDDKGDQDSNKESEINLKDIKLDDIPEAQRPIFKRLIDTTENLTNEVAKRDLIINTLKDVRQKPKEEEKKKDQENEEKILGILDKSDPYAPAFQKLFDEIQGFKTAKVKDAEKDFETNLIAFAQSNKDVVRYVKDMDDLLEEHPTLRGDIPKLYTLAKSIHERRENAKSSKKEELGTDRKRFSTERSGMSSEHVSSPQNFKTLADAFEDAEKKVVNRR